MTRRLAVALAILILAPMMALAQQQVSVDFDKTYDYSLVKTFAVQVGTAWGDPLAEKRVVGEIEAALTGKGWAKADPDKADATVLVHGATQTKKQLDAFYGGGGWAFRGAGSATVRETEYTVGTLVVDIFEAASKQLLFPGTAKDELAGTVEKNTKKLNKATTRMFADFPPGSNQKK